MISSIVFLASGGFGRSGLIGLKVALGVPESIDVKLR